MGEAVMQQLGSKGQQAGVERREGWGAEQFCSRWAARVGSRPLTGGKCLLAAGWHQGQKAGVEGREGGDRGLLACSSIYRDLLCSSRPACAVAASTWQQLLANLLPSTSTSLMAL
jgi:hypothetical protein